MSLAQSALPQTSGQNVAAAAVSETQRTGTDSTSLRPEDSMDSKKDGKTKKRSLFGLGKKKSDKEESQKSNSKADSATTSPPSLSRDISKLSSITRSTTSPTQSEQQQFTLPSSPGRGLSSSPRLSSPAGSQIFERDVQDSVNAMPTSPAIPSHIQTENHIPPVLDASSEAITNDHLDPDSVEIVTHSVHQPAGSTVRGTSPHPTYEQMAASWAEELGAPLGGGERDDASNYGSIDTTDVRRLSFISFADVVQSEHSMHLPGDRHSMHLAGLTTLSNVNRSPSPIRSPVSSQGPGTSPPTSKSGSMKGVEMSPSRKPLGSPTSGHHSLGTSDINIETMSQALRRTGSTDLSNARSHPASPIEGSLRQL